MATDRFVFSPELSKKALEYLLDYITVMDMKEIDFNSDLFYYALITLRPCARL